MCLRSIYKRIASLLPIKQEQHDGTTIAWIRCCLSFSLLRMCLRGARSSQGRAFRFSVIDLAVEEARVPSLSV